MCRGNRGCCISDNKKEFLAFSGRLATVVSALHVEIHAYAMEDVTYLAEKAKAQSILGRDRFLDRIRRILQQRPQRDGDTAHKRRQLLSESIAQALARVARVYNVTPEKVLRTARGRGGNEARQVALWHARERCAGIVSARDIGRAMGGVTGCAVVVAHQRMTQRLHHDQCLRGGVVSGFYN